MKTNNLWTTAITIITTLAILTTTTTARCDGNADPDWKYLGSCSGSGPCHEDCKSAGYICGGCGGAFWRECWCCNNSCWILYYYLLSFIFIFVSTLIFFSREGRGGGEVGFGVGLGWVRKGVWGVVKWVHAGMGGWGYGCCVVWFFLVVGWGEIRDQVST